jgi:ABC-type lipoprotein release transport system permease subunit
VNVFKMGWRNTWRQSRRSGVTIAAMTLALLVMILYAGLMEGYLDGMERSVLDYEVGDIQVFAHDYRDNPSLYTRIDAPDALVDRLEEAGLIAAPRVLAFGLAAAEDASAGVSFRGIDIARDAQVSEIQTQVERGRWLDPADPNGVVVGRRLARTLAVEPGAEILVLTQGSDGSMAYELLEVRGVLRGISDATDRGGLFMVADALRELLSVEDGAHQIIVRRPSGTDLAAVAALVAAAGEDLDVRTWRQLIPTVASLLDSARGAMVAMFVIVYIAVAILILNAMLMAVFERIREFGVLKALGASPLEVWSIIGIESLVQTGIAVMLGVGLSIPSLIYLRDVGIDLGTLAGTSVMGIAMDPIWRASIKPSVFVTPLTTLLTIVVLAVAYPALKAAWISPIEAMRYR